MFKIRPYLLPILWMLLIFTLSSFPGPAIPKYPFPGFDKLAHLIVYAVLAALWYCSLKIDFRRRLIVVVLISSLYAVSDEVHQLFVPLRYFSIGDLFADFFGAGVGALLAMGVKKWR